MEMVYAYPGLRLEQMASRKDCQTCRPGDYRQINPRFLKVTFEGEQGLTRRITCARCGRVLHVGFFRRPA